MKKIFSIVLTLCMVLSCFTVFSYAKTTYKAVWALKATADGRNYESNDTIPVKPGETVSVTLRLSNNYNTGPLSALIYYNNSIFEQAVPYEFNTNGSYFKTCGSTTAFVDWTSVHSTYKSRNDFWPVYSDASKLNDFKKNHYFAKLTMIPNVSVTRTPAYAVNENLITMNFKVSSSAANGSTGKIIIPVECMRTKANPSGNFYLGVYKTNDLAGEVLQYSDEQVFDCSNAVLNFKVSTGAKLGDVNKDSKINSSDALMILQNSVGLINLTKEQFSLADVTKDSNVNSSDALKILQYAVGQIKSF